MKTNSTAIKGFKAVDFMREVRDKISMDIKDMNFEEILKYMEARRLKNTSTYNSDSYSRVMESTVVSEATTTTYTKVVNDLKPENNSI